MGGGFGEGIVFLKTHVFNLLNFCGFNVILCIPSNRYGDNVLRKISILDPRAELGASTKIQ